MGFLSNIGIKINFPQRSQEEIDAEEKKRLEKEFWKPNTGEPALKAVSKIGDIDKAAQQRNRRR